MKWGVGIALKNSKILIWQKLTNFVQNIKEMSFFVSGDWYQNQNKMAKKEEKMPGRLSGAKEILMLLLLGVAGQSFDSYSDLGLSYRFAVGKIYTSEFNNTPI